MDERCIACRFESIPCARRNRPDSAIPESPPVPFRERPPWVHPCWTPWPPPTPEQLAADRVRHAKWDAEERSSDSYKCKKALRELADRSVIVGGYPDGDSRNTDPKMWNKSPGRNRRNPFSESERSDQALNGGLRGEL